MSPPAGLVVGSLVVTDGTMGQTVFSHYDCCLGWRPPTARAAGPLLPVQAVSSAAAFVTFSGSTTITLSFLQFATEDCFWYVYVFHPCDVTSPAQLNLNPDRR